MGGKFETNFSGSRYKLETKINIKDTLRFGTLLCKRRSDRKITAVEMARKLGLKATSSLENWEKSITFPDEKDEKKLRAIAEAYGIEWDEFLRDFIISKGTQKEFVNSQRSNRKTSKRPEPDFESGSGHKNNSAKWIKDIE